MIDITEEEIARAICLAEGIDPSGQSSWLTDEPLWTEYAPQARAVLAIIQPALERARWEEQQIALMERALARLEENAPMSALETARYLEIERRIAAIRKG